MTIIITWNTFKDDINIDDDVEGFVNEAFVDQDIGKTVCCQHYAVYDFKQCFIWLLRYCM